MKHRLFRNILLVLVAVATLSLSGCVNFRKVSLTSFEVSSFSPTGFRSADCRFTVGVNNGSSQFTVSDIEGMVKRDGNTFGTFVSDAVTVEAKTSSQYPVDVKVALDGSVSLLELPALLQNFDPEEFTVDVALKVKPKGGAAKRLSFKDVPLEDIVSMARQFGI